MLDEAPMYDEHGVSVGREPYPCFLRPGARRRWRERRLYIIGLNGKKVWFTRDAMCPDARPFTIRPTKPTQQPTGAEPPEGAEGAESALLDELGDMVDEGSHVCKSGP